MAKLILGFDCGGTKTQVDVVLSEEGRKEVIDTFFVGGMNVNSFGKEQVIAHLTDAFAKVGPQRLFEVKAIGFGAAGISNPLTQEVYLQGIRQAGCSVDPLFIGDHQAALWGAHAGGDGMILIAGTGSVCCGHIRRQDKMVEARCGGYGHLIDDEGSAYALGRDVLSAVVQSVDGRITPSVMKQAVFEQLGINTIQELIGFVYNKNTGKKDIAALAPVLDIGLEAQEEAAFRILEKAASNLANLIVPVADQLELSDGPLSFCGSVLTKNERIRDLTEKKIKERYPKMRIYLPQYDAAYGAALATGV